MSRWYVSAAVVTEPAAVNGFSPQGSFAGQHKDAVGCGACWRTRWSAEHTFPLFGKFIQDPKQREVWELSLLSFTSLMSEGHEKITEAMITQRMKLLRFLSSMLGSPLSPSVLVPL